MNLRGKAGVSLRNRSTESRIPLVQLTTRLLLVNATRDATHASWIRSVVSTTWSLPRWGPGRSFEHYWDFQLFQKTSHHRSTSQEIRWPSTKPSLRQTSSQVKETFRSRETEMESTVNNEWALISLRRSQYLVSNDRNAIHHPRGSKSPQSLLFGLFAAALPHEGCGGFEGANKPMPALKNGGGTGCDGCSGGVENEGIGLFWVREML